MKHYRTPRKLSFNKQWNEWSERTKHAISEVAEDIGVSQQCMNKYVHGHCEPPLRIAYAIELYTGGSVPMETWVRILSLQYNK